MPIGSTLQIVPVCPLWSGWLFYLGFLYRINNAGLNPLRLILVGTLLEILILFNEISAGVVANLLRRRFCISLLDIFHKIEIIR